MSREIHSFYKKEAELVSKENESLGIKKHEVEQSLEEDLSRHVTLGEMLSVVDDISKDIATMSERILELQILLRLLFENTDLGGNRLLDCITQKDFLMSLVENYPELMMSPDVSGLVDKASLSGVSRCIATELFTGKLFTV